MKKMIKFRNSRVSHLIIVLLFSLGFLASCDDDDPEMQPEEPESIVDIVVNNDNFSILEAALTKAGLVETLQGAGPFTAFAPTNAAFDALYQQLGVAGPAEIDDTTLEAVLTYHVLGARIFSSDLTNGAMPETLQGGNITIELGDNVTIADVDSGNEDATVSSADILGTNGVIHVIDQSLLPVDLQ